MKIKSLLVILIITLCGQIMLFGEIKEDKLSDGSTYRYYVPDKPSNPEKPENPDEKKEESEDENKEEKSDDDKKTENPSGTSGSSEQEAAEAIAKAKKEAEEAEAKMRAAIDILKDHRKVYDAKAAVYKNSDRSAVTYRTNCILELKHMKELELELISERDKLANKMNAAYRNLDDVYKKYNYTGDPVSINTGEYSVLYTDYMAQDFLQKFSVMRSWKKSAGLEAFGYGWSCSLDSRIIRCVPPSVENQFGIIQSLLEDVNYMVSECAYILSNYPQAGTEIQDIATEMGIEAMELSEALEFLKERQQLRNSLLDINKYVMYGRFSSVSSVEGFENILFLVDFDGNVHSFISDDNGNWNCAEDINREKIRLKELSGGGYLVSFDVERKFYYSRYGVLEKEVDRNGNVTQYLSENGKIKKVILKTGEEIDIQRNDSGLITVISGPVSGKTLFTYENSKLTSVISNQNYYLHYEYDSENNLTKIQKADGSFISIDYEFNPALGKSVCSAVTLENGLTEYFKLIPDKNKMIHTTVDGIDEEYIFNQWGGPVIVKDKYKKETVFEYYENGLIKSVKEGEYLKSFRYDSHNRLVYAGDENDSGPTIEYLESGMIGRVTDGDGFYNQYFYDEKGNLTQVNYCGNPVKSMDYDSKGQLILVSDDKTQVQYDYNQNGSVIAQVQTGDGIKKTQRWFYDDENRVVKYIDENGIETEIQYKDHQITTIENQRKKTQRFFDVRNREFKIVSEDLWTGEKYEKQNFYDNCGNVIKIRVNGEDIQEFSYSTDNVLISETVWSWTDEDSILQKQGVKSDYVYDSLGRLGEIKKIALPQNDLTTSEKYKYFNSGNQVEVTEINSWGVENKKIYNSKNQLIKQVYADGSWYIIQYSKAGRVIQIKDSSNNLYKYTYCNDGSYFITWNKMGTYSARYDFDNKDQIQCVTSIFGYKTYYTYDCFGNLIEVSGPGFEEKYSYDIYGRMTSYSISDGNGTEDYEYKVFYDDKNYNCKIIKGGYVAEDYKLDVWNRVVESNGSKGRQKYTYNCLSQIIRKTDFFGNQIDYEYDGNGKTALIGYDDGTKTAIKNNLDGRTLKVMEGDFCFGEFVENPDTGKITSFNIYGDASEVKLDETGRPVENRSYNSGKEKLEMDYDQKILTVNMANGGLYSYRFNEQGLVIEEKNSLGKTMEYDYDADGRVIKRKRFSGQIENYVYDEVNHTERLECGPGDASEIIRNSLGLVREARNNETDFTYTYDSRGNLTEIRDNISNTVITYEYDDYSRCIRKSTDNFDYHLHYDESGNLTKLVEKNSGSSVSFKYDLKNREIYREYSNGLKTETSYASGDLISSVVTRNSSGLIISADFVLRNQNGKIEATCDKNGSWSKYEYDEYGRLHKVIYPFTQELCDFYKQELVDCGAYLKDENLSGKNETLSEKIISDISELIQRAGCSFEVSVQKHQDSWVENIFYNETGGVETIEYSDFTIHYQYDLMNRLISKHSGNSVEEGIVYTWNDDGSLSEIRSKNWESIFSYGSESRPLSLCWRDLTTGEQEIVQYSYDVFGRRYMEKTGDHCLVYIYDGFSKNPIVSLPVFYDGSSVLNHQGIQTGDYNEMQNQDYRWIENQNYSAYEDSRGRAVSPSEYETKKADLSSASSTLWINNTPVFEFSVDTAEVSGLNCEVPVLNFKNNRVAVCDKNSSCISVCSYDVWGNLLSDGENPSFSYSTSTTGFGSLVYYNLGYRDYSPQMKGFTSMDPVRDGNNWFSFCPGDTLNYFDADGFLTASTPSTSLMTDVDHSILQGNSTTEFLYKVGCFITTIANTAAEMNKRWGEKKKYYGSVPYSKYDTPLKINANKSFFSTEEEYEACMDTKYVMDTIFGKGVDNWDYWTKEGSGSAVMQAELTKAAVVRSKEYLVLAVFDISEAQDGASTHMVNINSNFDRNGYLEKTAVSGSSGNDYKRINEYDQINYYNEDNLRRVYIVDTHNDPCANP